MSDLAAVDTQECQEPNMQIMQIIPDNQIAKKLFVKCYEHTKSTGDDCHKKFMVQLPITKSVLDDEPIESETDFDSASATDFNEQLYEGYYNISLGEELKPRMVKVGWKIGRGSNTSSDERHIVDILLAAPRDILSKSLPRIVCTLCLDSQLGLLVVQRPPNSRGVIEIKLDDSWEVFEAGAKRPLFKKSSWLRVGCCDYEFKYAVIPSEREQFLEQKNLILNARYISPMGTGPGDAKIQIANPRLPVLDYVPGDPAWNNGTYVRLGTIANGTFGYIYEGLNISSCQRIAIKELRLGRKRDCDDLLNELDVMSKLQGSLGVIPCDNFYCEHGYSKPCKIPENFYICFPRAIHDFSKLDWYCGHALKSRLQLLQQPLLGLHEIHKKGIIHRDVTVGNMLVLSYDPPQAVISDFGKAVCKKSHETTIGPIPTLAPEVWSATKDKPYDNAIDVWAYGYAVAQILKCAGIYKHNNRISDWEHADIQRELDDHARKHDEEADLVDLIKSMLTWDSHQRITIQLALAHRCWNKINVQSLKRSVEEAGFEISEQQTKASAPTRKSADSSARAIAKTQSFGSQTQRFFEGKF